MGLEDLSDLIERFYNTLGYETKFLEEGLLEISPPIDPSKLIEIHDKDLVITKPTKLAFNLKVARSHKIELITFESSTLNKIIEYIEKFGKIGKAFIPFTLPEKGNIIESLEKNESKITIKDADFKFLDLEINYSPFIVFDFLISFESLEKNEMLDTQIIPVYRSNRNKAYINYIREQLAEKYPFFAESPPYPGKILKMDEKQLKIIYLHALRRAELSVQEKESYFNQRVDKRLKKETDLLNNYYDTREREIIKDINRKHELQEEEFKTEDYKAKKKKEIEELEIELKRIRNEQERKSKELSSTYHTATTYQLESVGILFSPIDVLLNFKTICKYGTFTTGLQYDYTHQKLFPFHCKCGNIVENMTLNVCSRLHLCCDECLDRCHSCSDVLCKTCGKFCEECSELYCEKHIYDHFDSCSICNKLVCKKRLYECHACKKIACKYNCLTKCITCDHYFCIECIERCDICNQPICSSHTFTCLNCNNQVCEKHYLTCATCGKSYCSSCMTGCDICKSELLLHSSYNPKNSDDYNKVHCNECKIQCEICQRNLCRKHAHYCKGCGKAICSDHALRCKDCGEYFCNECVIRCKRCDTPICMNCVKTCEISGHKFCSEHVVECTSCNRIISDKLIKYCSCKKPVCTDCSLKCDFCKKVLCKECSSVCEFCSRVVCAEHVNRCQICGALSCYHTFRGNLTKKGHTNKCVIGGELVCNNCIRTCSTCKNEVCTKHVHECWACKEIICDNCMKRCAICGKILCKDHSFSCFNCNESFCAAHLKKCQICLNLSCENDFTTCVSCGQESCNQHFPSLRGNICMTCDLMEPINELDIKIKDEKDFEIISMIMEPISWEFGINPAYSVHKGTTSKQVIAIVTKNNGEQIITIKDTLWGKIIKPFTKLFKKIKRNN